jgi:hypothetical protein
MLFCEDVSQGLLLNSRFQNSIQRLSHDVYQLFVKLCYLRIYSFDFTGGAGGRGTWGSLLETDGEADFDKNDPNYDSETVTSRPLFHKL